MANVSASNLVVGDRIYLGTLRHYEITKIVHYASGRIGINYIIPELPIDAFYDSVWRNRKMLVWEGPSQVNSQES